MIDDWNGEVESVHCVAVGTLNTQSVTGEIKTLIKGCEWVARNVTVKGLSISSGNGKRG